MLKKAGSILAAEHVKKVFSCCVTVGGGGRGGRPTTVINSATRAATAAACVFADYFEECEKGFDAIAFFRACLVLPEKWIEHEIEIRARYERKAIDTVWKEASRMARTARTARTARSTK